MSDTPRTDAAEHRVNYIGAEGECDYMAVTADFARQLERELAAVCAANDRLTILYHDAQVKALADGETTLEQAHVAGLRAVASQHDLCPMCGQSLKGFFQKHG